MKLIELLITKRATSAAQLPTGLARLAQADPAARQVLAENRALGLLIEQAPAAPAWQDMRKLLEAGENQTKENHMHTLSRLFISQPWPVRLGLAMLLALGLAVIALLLPLRQGFAPGTVAWADSAGYKVTLELPVNGSQCDSPELDVFNQAIDRWSKEIKTAREAARKSGGKPQEIKIQVILRCKKGDSPDGMATVTARITGATSKEMDRLREVLADVPGLPAPSIEEASWLTGDKTESDGEPFIDIPKDATDEEIRQLVLAWYKETHPGKEATVEVTRIETPGPNGKKQQQIRIRLIPKE